MSKELENVDHQEDILEFEEATQMTVKDALDKEADLQAGVTEQDGILDKYIKKHSEEVDEQKYLNKVGDLDNEVLRQFIQKQRAELAERKAELLAGTAIATGVLEKTGLDEVREVTDKAETEVLADSVDFDEATVHNGLLDDSSVLEDKPTKKNKFLVAGALGVLFLGVVGAGYGLNYLNQSANQANKTTQETSSSSTTSSVNESAELKAFNELYKTFFADEGLTKPKNSEFERLSDLEAALTVLEGTEAYEKAKAKFDGLTKMITAIQAVNDKFESPAIVDGEKVEAVLKEGASFDDLSSEVLNTGKASLDTLIQAVIAEGRGLLGAVGNVSGGAVGVPSGQADATSVEQPSVATEAPQSVEVPAVTEAVAQVATPEAGGHVVYGSQVGQTVAVRGDLPAGHVQSPTNYGLVSYDPSTLQRHLSRVPFNFDLIADATNSAWVFTPGVMEEIIRVSQQRGYINGNEFILEPVNIVNGNGYYNMYKPDGTYLFSINAKTGYFVGNGRGYAEELDY